MALNIPKNLRYAKSHEWLQAGNGMATIGITDHAQHELTDVVFIELPAKGRILKAGETFAVVESVKTASDIYAPVSGEIIAVNDQLSSNPALVNTSPYEQGWLIKIKVSHPGEIESLLTPETYAALIGG
jgi:glycine cleavage system H protein